MAGTVSVIVRGTPPPTMLDVIGTTVTDVISLVAPEVVAIGIVFLVLVTGIAVFQRLRGVADDTLYHDEVLGQYDYSRNPEPSFSEPSFSESSFSEPSFDSLSMSEYEDLVDADDLEDAVAAEDYEGRVATQDDLALMEEDEEYQAYLDDNLSRG